MSRVGGGPVVTLATRPDAEALGERRLMLAILEARVRRLVYPRRPATTSLTREAALAWLLSEDRSDRRAFENVCRVLGLEATQLRERVLSVCHAARVMPAVQSSKSTRGAATPGCSARPGERWPGASRRRGRGPLSIGSAGLTSTGVPT